jgi:hypothetical protein
MNEKPKINFTEIDLMFIFKNAKKQEYLQNMVQ